MCQDGENRTKNADAGSRPEVSRRACAVKISYDLVTLYMAGSSTNAPNKVEIGWKLTVLDYYNTTQYTPLSHR